LSSSHDPDALGICKNPHRIVIGESPHFLMSASVEARIGSSRDPHYVTVPHGAGRNRDGNPSKTIDSLACKNRSRRLRIHVVDGHDHVVGAIVIDSDRYRIVGANRGGEDLIAEQPKSNGIAKRLRKNKESAPGTIVMKTVVCPQCGEQFAIGHKLALQDPALATRQATWLADQFVWDHIQENKHQGSIQLPGLDEMK